MFHSPHPILPADSWKKTPQRGDIVRFRRFIRYEQEAGNTSFPRPCLVLNVVELDGQFVSELVGEARSVTSSSRGYEVTVCGGAGKPSGLSRTARFDCKHRLRVTFHNPGFAAESTSENAILDHLNEALIARMNVVRARIQTEADITAFLREEGRRERTTWAAEACGFRERNRALAAQTLKFQKGDM